MAVTAVVAAVSAVSALASAGVSYYSSQQQAEAQEDYNKYLRDQAIQQYAELDKQEADVIEASYKESMQAQKEYLQARSSIELQAAATGTYGQSIDLAIKDLGAGLGRRMSEITTNRERQLDNIDTQARSIQSGVSSSADYSIQQPAFYQALSSGIGTFGSVYSMGSKVGQAYTQSRQAVTAQ